MNIINCGKGHLYDVDKSKVCPWCAKGNSPETTGGLSGRPDNSLETDFVTQNFIEGRETGLSRRVENYQETEPSPNNNLDRTMPDSNHNFSNSSDYGVTMPATMPATTPITIDVDSSNTLSREIEDYDGKTEPAYVNDVYGFAPVTGWLVCIEGVEKGKDYRIRVGYNQIGRGENMHICIKGDNKISRNNHATIAYDDIENAFFFAPSQGENFVRVNNKLVMQQTKLSPYDIITVGRTKLVFIPLCGDIFNWKDIGGTR